MPVQYNTLNQQPDILGAFRHQLLFGEVPGSNNELLMLNNVRLTLPEESVGHVLVKVLGHSLGFAGGLTFENTLSASFYENVKGEALLSLRNWRNRARNPVSGAGLLKANYAIAGQLVVYSPTDEVVHRFKLTNVWPYTIQTYEVGEEAQPAEIQVQFSVDRVELEGEQFPEAGNTPPRSLNVSQFMSDYGSAIR